VSHLSDRLPATLSVGHILFFGTTALFGDKIASGGNPLFCVDLPVSLPLVARDNATTILTVGVLGTAWWYFIGQIGRASWMGKMSRMMSLAGSLLLLFLAAVSSFAMSTEFLLISKEPNFGSKDVVVYTLATALLLGGLTTAGYTMASVFRSSRS
jgi:hypothetical protein